MRVRQPKPSDIMSRAKPVGHGSQLLPLPSSVGWIQNCPCCSELPAPYSKYPPWNGRESSPDRSKEIATRKMATSAAWQDTWQQAQGNQRATAVPWSKSRAGIGPRDLGAVPNQPKTSILCPEMFSHKTWNLLGLGISWMLIIVTCLNGIFPLESKPIPCTLIHPLLHPSLHPMLIRHTL